MRSTAEAEAAGRSDVFGETERACAGCGRCGCVVRSRGRKNCPGWGDGTTPNRVRCVNSPGSSFLCKQTAAGSSGGWGGARWRVRWARWRGPLGGRLRRSSQAAGWRKRRRVVAWSADLGVTAWRDRRRLDSDAQAPPGRCGWPPGAALRPRTPATSRPSQSHPLSLRALTSFLPPSPSSPSSTSSCNFLLQIRSPTNSSCQLISSRQFQPRSARG